MKPIPDRIPEPLWYLARHVQSKIKWLKAKWPVTSGYHARPIDIPTDDYSVIRRVDAKGPQEMIAAIDFVCGEDSIWRMVKLSRALRSAYVDMYDGRIGPWNLAELSGPTSNKSITGFVHGRPGISHIHGSDTIHIGIRRDMVTSEYVMEAIRSVLLSEPLFTWERNR